MKAEYKIMTFAANGNPIPIEIKTHNTREEAEKRMDELRKVYSVPMSIREINGR
jgi:hypothetical protein